jgi:hypothetical protein
MVEEIIILMVMTWVVEHWLDIKLDHLMVEEMIVLMMVMRWARRMAEHTTLPHNRFHTPHCLAGNNHLTQQRSPQNTKSPRMMLDNHRLE